MIDLKGKSFVIFGQKGQGKSTLADYILNQKGDAGIYYDTQWEAPISSKYDVLRPDDKYSTAEICAVMKQVRLIKHYDILVIDESNRFAPAKPKPLPDELAEWNDSCRHFNKGFGCICRRPTQLHQDITELADWLFIYRLTGKNDVKYLNEINAGLGDALLELPDFHFLAVGPDKKWSVQPPIQPSKKWVKYAAQLIKDA